MLTYHLRRSEKEITHRSEIIAIIKRQNHLTMAMCKDNLPYLVTVNYGYDEEQNCFYFHCAAEGKKIDYLKANRVVWGQILEDWGYLDGKCDHAFRTVQFLGKVTFVEDPEEKRYALSLMIDHLESDPETVKRRQVKPESVDKVTIGKVTVEMMTGKQNLP